MTLIFQDLFAEAANTPLESHTPDLGDGWLVIYDTAATVNVLVKPVGHSRAEDVVGPSGSENSVGMAFAIQPAPGVADVTLTFDRYMLNWEVTNSYGTGVFARHSESGGSHTFYGLRMVPNLHSQATLRLYKVVNNAGTLLGEYDHTFQNGDVITFECHDNAKRVLVNGVERIISTDNDIAGPGNAGIWWGTFTTAMGTLHLRGEMEYGFFEVDAPVSGGTVELDASLAGGTAITAALDIVRLLSAAVGDAATNITAALLIVRRLDASLAGETVADADLGVAIALAADATGGTIADADLGMTFALAADAAGETVMTATPEVLGQVELMADIAGDTEIAADLSAQRNMTALAAGETAIGADLVAALALAAGADGETAVDATLGVLSFVDLVADIAGETAVTAMLNVLQLGAVGDVRMWFEVPDQADLSVLLTADVRIIGEPLTAATVTFESVA